MDHFVERGSVVREIWGKGDTILFIFAGASAEFALNKAVDWLYFTGRLPADPLGRLFSTVQYARQIVFSSKERAYKAIDKMRTIHSGVEAARGTPIPDWAYRDVLFMLIYYSIASFEVLERKLTVQEKEEVFQVFYRVGSRMGVKELPASYGEWLSVRSQHLEQDLQRSNYTIDLYRQYKKHLGYVRYVLLLQTQTLVVPAHVRKLLHLGNGALIKLLLVFYKISRMFKLDRVLKSALLPAAYKPQIKALDEIPVEQK